MSKSKCIEPAKQLHEFLNKIPDQLGKVTGFVQRRSKMTSAVFIQTLFRVKIDGTYG